MFSHRLIHHGRKNLQGPQAELRRMLPGHRGVHASVSRQPRTAKSIPRSEGDGMILTGDEIRRNLNSNILIDPFDERQLNPNSYNLTLARRDSYLRRNRAGHAEAESHSPHDHSAGRLGVESQSALFGADGRTHRNTQSSCQ